jgi:hypothetical protein
MILCLWGTAYYPIDASIWTEIDAAIAPRAANALYLPTGTVIMPDPMGTTSAYGMFLPIDQSYAGAGRAFLP